ncbi:Transcription factor ORG2 [Morella rubra]|uniref:Transcription factor ORG2 n=1 Tax=Morella rubra TaxID=262757 RepID=A0A6A1VWQ7_9ROSI|nr:Transcription factor ORG2 [Morella rubra]
MLASPLTSFSTINAWPLEDPLRHDQHTNYIYTETNEASESFVHYPSSQPKVELNRSTPSTSISSDPTMFKKLYHNASERDRRKKINCLYSTLRALLPAAEQAVPYPPSVLFYFSFGFLERVLEEEELRTATPEDFIMLKKLSIPATVARVVKYVPELQQQVEELIQKKEELLSRISRQGEQFHQGNQRVQNPARSSSSSVSANWLNDREVMIQISTYKVDRSPLDEILLNLEKDGFLLQNASSFESSGGRVFYNLHLQVDRAHRLIDREVLNEKLLSLSEKGEDQFNHQNLGSIYFSDMPIQY